MGVLGYPKGSALELLDGTLKLRHCTDLFTKRFLPWSLGKRHFVTTDHLFRSLLVALLVLILLLGHTVLVFCLDLLLFLLLYIGLLVLTTLVILVYHFLSFLSFLSNGLDTDCLVKRLLGRMCPVSEAIEIRHGCQFLCCLVRALAKLPGGLGRFLPFSLGSHLSRLRHLGWNQCSHGLTSRPLESCHHQCLQAVCGVLGYPKGSALELLDGTLKLRHCTDLFTMRFPLSRAKKSTAGELDGWAWNEVKALPLPWFSGLAILLELVESTGTWPQGLLDAYIAMIPKADGDSTLLGQRPLSVLSIVHRIWASARMG